MKFWNKDKEIRQRCWTRVTRTLGTSSTHEVKRWCQHHPSTGKFYYYYGTNSWWFEFADDALAFKLKWQ